MNEDLEGKINKKLNEEEDEKLSEFSAFMKKVDEVNNIVKGLTSEDQNIVKNSIKRADKIIKNKNSLKEKYKYEEILNDEKLEKETKELNLKERNRAKKPEVNKTIINEKAFKESDKKEEMEPEAFMKVIEEDAKKRNEVRKSQKAEADILKKEGEKLFSEEKYNEALEKLNEALKVFKNWSSLWCCRAQIHIQLKNYKEAWSDIDWAFRANEKSLTAFVTQAKYFLATEKPQEAVVALEKAVSIHGNNKTCLKYLNQAREEVDKKDKLEKN